MKERKTHSPSIPKKNEGSANVMNKTSLRRDSIAERRERKAADIFDKGNQEFMLESKRLENKAVKMAVAMKTKFPNSPIIKNMLKEIDKMKNESGKTPFPDVRALFQDPAHADDYSDEEFEPRAFKMGPNKGKITAKAKPDDKSKARDKSKFLDKQNKDKTNKLADKTRTPKDKIKPAEKLKPMEKSKQAEKQRKSLEETNSAEKLKSAEEPKSAGDNKPTDDKTRTTTRAQDDGPSRSRDQRLSPAAIQPPTPEGEETPRVSWKKEIFGDQFANVVGEEEIEGVSNGGFDFGTPENDDYRRESHRESEESMGKKQVRQWVLVDTLDKGDRIGDEWLDYRNGPYKPPQENLTLVSDGVELIMIRRSMLLEYLQKTW